MQPISIMLVDDNPVFLRATAQFLEAHDDVLVVGTADRGDTALERVQDLKPQTVLIDLAMPGLPGLQTIPQLRQMLPEVGIIALTVMNSQGFRQAALDAGADMFIPKSTLRKDLLPAIRRLAREGRPKVESQLAAKNEVSTSGKRVLIIEDDAHLRRLYSKALKSAGYDVRTAATLQETRDFLSNMEFSLLLCDVTLGKERGTDVLDEYAETLALTGAQVVMVSGHAHYRDVCADFGADFFLEKPVAVGTLVTLVKRLTAQGS